MRGNCGKVVPSLRGPPVGVSRGCAIGHDTCKLTMPGCPSVCMVRQIVVRQYAVIPGSDVQARRGCTRTTLEEKIITITISEEESRALFESKGSFFAKKLMHP